MAYPANYYVIPEHHIRLTDDRTELVFEQHLPGVSKDDINVEVLEESVCLDFKAQGKDPVARCYSLPYLVDPSSATGEFKDNRLEIRARLQEVLRTGKRVDLL